MATKAQAQTKAPAAATTAPAAAPTTTPAAPVLLAAVGGKAPRAGTASAACYAALLANVGQPRAVVLAALAAAETQWHQTNGRTVKGVAPAGWLRTHQATFA